MTLVCLKGVSEALLDHLTRPTDFLCCLRCKLSFLRIGVILREEQVRHSLTFRVNFVSQLQERQVATLKMSVLTHTLRVTNKEAK